MGYRETAFTVNYYPQSDLTVEFRYSDGTQITNMTSAFLWNNSWNTLGGIKQVPNPNATFLDIWFGNYWVNYTYGTQSFTSTLVTLNEPQEYVIITTSISKPIDSPPPNDDNDDDFEPLPKAAAPSDPAIDGYSPMLLIGVCIAMLVVKKRDH